MSESEVARLFAPASVEIPDRWQMARDVSYDLGFERGPEAVAQAVERLIPWFPAVDASLDPAGDAISRLLSAIAKTLCDGE